MQKIEYFALTALALTLVLRYCFSVEEHYAALAALALSGLVLLGLKVCRIGLQTGKRTGAS